MIVVVYKSVLGLRQFYLKPPCATSSISLLFLSMRTLYVLLSTYTHPIVILRIMLWSTQLDPLMCAYLVRSRYREESSRLSQRQHARSAYRSHSHFPPSSYCIDCPSSCRLFGSFRFPLSLCLSPTCIWPALWAVGHPLRNTSVIIVWRQPCSLFAAQIREFTFPL
jgi:hypothetical protein